MIGKKIILFQDLPEIATKYNNILEEPETNLTAIIDLIHLLNIFFKKSVVRIFFVFNWKSQVELSRDTMKFDFKYFSSIACKVAGDTSLLMPPLMLEE